MSRVEVDWEAMSCALGVGESGGTEIGRRAITQLLGTDVLRSAVRAYLDGEPGRETARSVLLVLRAPEAAEACWEIFRASTDATERETAIELLRSLGDPRMLARYDEVVRTSEARGERYWAADGVAELASLGDLDRETEDAWIDRLARDDDWHVASVARRVRQLSRNERSESPREPALRAVLVAAGWTLDEHGLAFLVAHFLDRAPDATPTELAARLRTSAETRPTSDEALVSLAARLITAAR